MGATREQVLTRYGEPKSTLLAGPRELLFYARERIVLRDGVVVEVERIAASEPTKRATPPAPAPSTAPAETAAPTTSTAEPAAPAKLGSVATKQPAPATKQASAADAQTARAATTETPAVSTTSAAAAEPPPPPPEPRLEIKRVLPPGASSAPTTTKKAATSTAPVTTATTATPPAVAPSSGGPAAVPSAAAPAAAGASPSRDTTKSPGATASTAPTAQPESITQPTTTATAATETDVVTDPAAEKKETPAKAVSSKEAAKKAAEIKAARRKLEQATADAIDPTASVFTTRTYAISLLVIGSGIGYLVWRYRQRQLELAASAVSRTPFSAPAVPRSGAVFTADTLAKLEWKRFEELVASYYSKTGVVATRTKKGPAAPVHIKISWKGEPRPFALVQCIAQPTALIDAKPLQELFAVLTAEDIRRGYVVTTGKFNIPARDFAEEKHITLLPGDIFLEKLNALPDAARAELMQETTEGDFTTPSCPKCEAKMVRSAEDPSVYRCATHPEEQITARV